jgi:GDP-L-fucose synthase
MNKTSKIYIAGHKGLLGSSILKKLEKEGYNNLVYKNSKELDLRIQKQVEDFFEKEKPEYVFLVAAKVGGIKANKEKKAEFIYDNLQIQNNVIFSSWKYKVKKLLYTASNCMYPKDSIQPMKEEYILTGPLEPTNDAYAIAKLAGVKMCQAFNLQYGTNFISTVPAGLYGPNDNFDPEDSHFIPALIRKFHDAKIQNKKEIVLWGTGKPLRELMYVEDSSDACLFLMKNYNSSEIINSGTGKEYFIKDIAEKIKFITRFNGEILFDSTKPDGVMRKLLENSRIKELGWEPKFDIDNGLIKTYNWFIKNAI